MRIVSLFVGVSIIAGLVYDFVKTLKKRKSTAITPLQRTKKIDPAIGMDAFEASTEEAAPFPSDEKNQNLAPTDEEPFTPEKIIALTVVSRSNTSFFGRSLLHLFEQLGLSHGEKSIFHHYVEKDEDKLPLFSVASIKNPGTFDLQAMGGFKTPGLVFFFVVSSLNQSIAAFEAMLRTARLTAQKLGGELGDESRRPLTARGIELYRERIRQLLSAA